MFFLTYIELGDNMIDILNEYMANIKVEINNLYNMHFNIVGSSFFEVHKKLEEYIKKFSLFYDEIAQRIKMLNGYPLTNLIKIEELSQIKSMQSRDYTGDMVKDVLENDFTYLKDYSKDLINYFSKENDIYTSHMLLEIMSYLEKEAWMIKMSRK